MKLQNAVSEIVRWRLNSTMRDVLGAVNFAEKFIQSQLSVFSVTARSCVYWMNELTKIDKRFSLLFSRCSATRCVQNIKKRFQRRTNGYFVYNGSQLKS